MMEPPPPKAGLTLDTVEVGERARSERAATTATVSAAPTEPGSCACPRCDSEETKFCYFNNYNRSQPRYFCKVRDGHRPVGRTSQDTRAARAPARPFHASSRMLPR